MPGLPARELTAIVQEALSNVLQHASATAVSISLSLSGRLRRCLAAAGRGQRQGPCGPRAHGA